MAQSYDPGHPLSPDQVQNEISPLASREKVPNWAQRGPIEGICSGPGPHSSQARLCERQSDYGVVSGQLLGLTTLLDQLGCSETLSSVYLLPYATKVGCECTRAVQPVDWQSSGWVRGTLAPQINIGKHHLQPPTIPGDSSLPPVCLPPIKLLGPAWQFH